MRSCIAVLIEYESERRAEAEGSSRRGGYCSTLSSRMSEFAFSNLLLFWCITLLRPLYRQAAAPSHCPFASRCLPSVASLDFSLDTDTMAKLTDEGKNALPARRPTLCPHRALQKVTRARKGGRLLAVLGRARLQRSGQLNSTTLQLNAIL